MNQTPNYALNQWEASDRVQRTDFNADNAKIDGALAGKGDCRIVWGSYTGTGEHGQTHPNTLTFPFPPKIVIFCQKESYSPNHYAIAIRGQTRFCHFNCHSYTEACACTWTENGLSWYSPGGVQDQLNNGDYFYVAFG